MIRCILHKYAYSIWVATQVQRTADISIKDVYSGEGKLEAHTLKKFSNEDSSVPPVAAAADVGSRGPSITDILGTASSSSNSLHEYTFIKNRTRLGIIKGPVSLKENK